MRSYLITIILLISLSSISNAQKKVDVKEMVGFGCYSSGIQSKPVSKVTALINNVDYESVLKLLNSKNNAEKFLAVITCERLQELGKIRLNEEQKKQIKQSYTSKDLVSVCSGCIYWDKLSFKTLLDKKEKNQIRELADYWLERQLKKE